MDNPTTMLLQRWHDGDRKALDELLGDHLAWITTHVHRRLGPVLRAKGETMDYVEDTIVEFLDHGPRFVLSNGKHFRALLARIAENVLAGNHRWWKAARRDLGRERPLSMDTVLVLDPPHAAQPSPSEHAERNEREALMRLGLELLQPEQREIIVLRDYRHVPLAEIAERLGTSSNTVQKRYERARSRRCRAPWARCGGAAWETSSIAESDRGGAPAGVVRSWCRACYAGRARGLAGSPSARDRLPSGSRADAVTQSSGGAVLRMGYSNVLSCLPVVGLVFLSACAATNPQRESNQRDSGFLGDLGGSLSKDEAGLADASWTRAGRGPVRLLARLPPPGRDLADGRRSQEAERQGRRGHGEGGARPGWARSSASTGTW